MNGGNIIPVCYTSVFRELSTLILETHSIHVNGEHVCEEVAAILVTQCPLVRIVPDTEKGVFGDMLNG